MGAAVSEPHGFAALSSGLLARKGSAKPAMRRQDTSGFSMANFAADPAKMEDLGWNDWGHGEGVPAIEDVATSSFMPMPGPLPAQAYDDFGIHAETASDAFDLQDPTVNSEYLVAADTNAELDALDLQHSQVVETVCFAGRDPEFDDPDVDHEEAAAYAAEDEGDDGSTSMPMASLVSELPEPVSRKPDVLLQIENLAERINRNSTALPPRVEAVDGRRAAFTLRLDADRHFRLRMAGLMLNRSAQAIVTEALDRYLSEHAELSALSQSASQRV